MTIQITNLIASRLYDERSYQLSTQPPDGMISNGWQVEPDPCSRQTSCSRTIGCLFIDWGWAGQGYSSNLHPEVHKHAEGDPMSIIVSRSHTGDVGDVAKKALGENTNIVPAGGAGKTWQKNIYIYKRCNCLHKKKSIPKRSWFHLMLYVSL